MPLLDIRDLSPHTRLGLWRMDELPEELYRLCPHLSAYRDELANRYRNDVRRQEFLCVRALLSAMTGQEGLRIDHAPTGRPLLDGWHLSISHTKGYCALILSRDEEVAVDIEQRSDRVARVASRFIRPDEQADDIEAMLLLWSAKETLYKLYSSDDLQFFDMQAVAKGNRYVTLVNRLRGVSVSVGYEFSANYVLTWAFLPVH